MGIIKAAAGAASGMWDDQWKEVFYCDAMQCSEMLVRGHKRTSPNSGNNGSDDVITEGSLIIVNEGQCALVVDNGVVVASYNEPGEYKFHSPKNPKSLLQEFGRRISYGGDAPYLNHRIYFINLHEFYNHPFAVTLPASIGAPGGTLTEDMTLRGVYCCRIADPVLFYQKVTGNVREQYLYSSFRGQLDAEVRDAILSAACDLCSGKYAPDQLGSQTRPLVKAVRQRMKNGHAAALGVEVTSITIGADVPLGRVQRRENLDAIRMPMPGTPDAPHVVPKGAPLRYTPRETPSYKVYPAAHLPGIGRPAEPPKPVDASWLCQCGCRAESKFCPECGKAKPWTCACGAQNQGNFCAECGKPKPVA